MAFSVPQDKPQVGAVQPHAIQPKSIGNETLKKVAKFAIPVLILIATGLTIAFPHSIIAYTAWSVVGVSIVGVALKVLTSSTPRPILIEHGSEEENHQALKGGVLTRLRGKGSAEAYEEWLKEEVTGHYSYAYHLQTSSEKQRPGDVSLYKYMASKARKDQLDSLFHKDISRGSIFLYNHKPIHTFKPGEFETLKEDIAKALGIAELTEEQVKWLENPDASVFGSNIVIDILNLREILKNDELVEEVVSYLRKHGNGLEMLKESRILSDDQYQAIEDLYNQHPNLRDVMLLHYQFLETSVRDLFTDEKRFSFMPDGKIFLMCAQSAALEMQEKLFGHYFNPNLKNNDGETVVYNVDHMKGLGHTRFDLFQEENGQWYLEVIYVAQLSLFGNLANLEGADHRDALKTSYIRSSMRIPLDAERFKHEKGGTIGWTAPQEKAPNLGRDLPQPLPQQVS